MAHSPVLEELEGYGSEEVMLPAGIELRVELPLVLEMVRSGALPGTLRALALSFASEEGVDTAALAADERAKWDELVNVLVCRSVKAVRTVVRSGPADTVCRCGGWHTDAPFQAFTFTPETLSRLPRVDIVALHDLVLRIRTLGQVDALSRVAHGQMDADQAAAIVRSERGATLDGWASFREFRRGTFAGADGLDMGQPPVEPADHLGAGARPRARRRAGTPTRTAAKGRRAVRKG